MAPHLLAAGVIGIACDADLAALRLALAGQHLDQLALAVAGDAGDADDLAGADRERDVMHGDGAGVVERADLAASSSRGLAGFAGARRLHGQLLGADHGARHRVRREFGDLAGAGELAAAQDRDVVGEGHDLAELVRDHQDGQLALDDHVAEHAEHLVGLRRRQHRGRLVQDQEAALQIELLEDLASSAARRREMSETLAPSGTLNGIRARKASSSFISFGQFTTAGTSSRASTRFSATVMAGTSVKCW